MLFVLGVLALYLLERIFVTARFKRLSRINAGSLFRREIELIINKKCFKRRKDVFGKQIAQHEP